MAEKHHTKINKKKHVKGEGEIRKGERARGEEEAPPL